MTNVIDLNAERARRAPRPAPTEPELLTVHLIRSPGDICWAFAGTEYESADYTSLETANAMHDGWLSITGSEMHVSPADITVAYIVVTKDGRSIYWVDPDAIHSPTEVVSALQDGLNDVAMSLHRDKVGGV